MLAVELPLDPSLSFCLIFLTSFVILSFCTLTRKFLVQCFHIRPLILWYYCYFEKLKQFLSSSPLLHWLLVLILDSRRNPYPDTNWNLLAIFLFFVSLPRMSISRVSNLCSHPLTSLSVADCNWDFMFLLYSLLPAKHCIVIEISFSGYWFYFDVYLEHTFSFKQINSVFFCVSREGTQMTPTAQMQCKPILTFMSDADSFAVETGACVSVTASLSSIKPKRFAVPKMKWLCALLLSFDIRSLRDE